MQRPSPLACVAVTAAAALGTTGVAAATSGGQSASAATTAKTVKLKLTPSSPALQQCMPYGRVNVAVRLTTEDKGFDEVTVKARKLLPNRAYTLFLLEKAEFSFGAAEYFGDFTTDRYGNRDAKFKLIVEEAFASTEVGEGAAKQRVRVDLDRMGAWFADPAADDVCAGVPAVTTPFDGDGEAGVQAVNSRLSPALP